jgi:hypothetical protein
VVVKKQPEVLDHALAVAVEVLLLLVWPQLLELPGLVVLEPQTP